MKEYSIGDFAKKLGVTPDFLKYYEKQGLLQPKKTPSGYRYYEASSTSAVNECIKLKNWGFSSKEIEKLLHTTTYEKTVGYFEERRTGLLQQIQFLQGLVEYSENMSRSLPYYSGIDQWNIMKKEGFYYLSQSKNFQLNDNISHIVKEWVAYMPLVSVTARVNYSPAAPVIEWGFSVPQKIVNEQLLPITEPVEWIPPMRYLEFYDRRVLEDNPQNDDLNQVRNNMFINVNNIIEKYQLHVAGASFFMVETKIREEGKRYTYQKIYVPLSEAKQYPLQDIEQQSNAKKETIAP
jgi:DNA-binding transcriptional MerR regulator